MGLENLCPPNSQTRSLAHEWNSLTVDAASAVAAVALALVHLSFFFSLSHSPIKANY